MLAKQYENASTWHLGLHNYNHDDGIGNTFKKIKAEIACSPKVFLRLT